MFYVYYLRSKKAKDQFYVGYTADLQERVALHNKGEVKSTKPYSPWEVIFYEAFSHRLDAKRREEYLKTTKGRKTIKIMLRKYFDEY
jgi:putative endonuclease